MKTHFPAVSRIGIRSAVILALLMLLTVPAHSQQDPAAPPAAPQPQPVPGDSGGGIGVGVLLGEPSGISLKGWLSRKTAIDGAAAYSFRDRDSLHLHADYLWHSFDLLPVARGKLPLFYGAGGRVKFIENHDTRVGIRGPVGLAYLFDNAPVDVFVEVAPILDVAPSVRFDFNCGIGVRYFFR